MIPPPECADGEFRYHIGKLYSCEPSCDTLAGFRTEPVRDKNFELCKCDAPQKLI